MPTPQCAPRLVLAPALVLAVFLSACAGSETSSRLDSAEPAKSEPEVVEVIMPADLQAAFPNGHVFSVSRFVSRTLETAPDGQSRRWPTNDPAVILVIRPENTEFVGDTVCRRATIVIENRTRKQQFDYRACRTATGVWVP